MPQSCSSLFLFLVFRDRVSLCGFGAYPGTRSGVQAGLVLTEIRLPLLGLKVCTTNARLWGEFLHFNVFAVSMSLLFL